MNITEDLARNLIKTQFPQYSKLPIKAVEQQGHDNRTFHLGDDFLIRIPSSKAYASKVTIEQKWLPELAENLSLKIPTPIHIGKSSDYYPFNWSIYKWIEGKSLNLVAKDEINLIEIAAELSNFLNELHKIDIASAPIAGKHNFYRGANIEIYFDDSINNIKKLGSMIDSKKAISIMEKAIESKWDKQPVWIHGDLAVGNILIKDNKVNAVIDFGGMAVGDPACDLVLYWNLFKENSKKIFKSGLNIDQNTWNRAKGWALWKACFEVINRNDKSKQEWLNILATILK